MPGQRAIAVTLALLSGAAVAGELQTVTLQLKWKHQFQFAGYYVAQEMGYYREAGLDVRFLEAEPAIEPIEAVLSGTAQYGVGTSDLLLYRAKGRPVVVLGVVFQHSPLALVALQRSGISKVNQLADKRVMIEPHSAELLAFLRREGLPLTRVTQQVHSFDVADLLEGRTDAMSVYSTDEPWALEAAGQPFFSMTPRTAGIDFYGDNLFTTEAELAQNPERVEAFRAASFRGWKEAMEHPEAAVELILRHYGGRKTREQLLFEAQQMAPLLQPDLVEPGYMHAGRWRHMASVYAEVGLLEGEVPLTGFLYAHRPGMPAWVGWALAGLAALTLLGGLAAALVLRANRALEAEIVSRAESEQRFRALFEAAPEPTWVLVDERIVACSASAATALGYARRDDLKERSVLELTPDDVPGGRASWAAHVAEARRQGFARFEWTLSRVGGAPLPVDLTLASVRWRDRDALHCTFRDTSLHKEAEAALVRARTEAESASRLKSLFLATMSHELRTPLHAITSLAWLGQRERDPAQLQEYFSQVRESSETLVSLVNDALDFSRIEAGRLNIERIAFELRRPLMEVRALFEGPAKEKGLAFGFEVDDELPAQVLGDPLRVKQVLTNLCSNAVKFTEAGGVTVRAMLLERRGPRATVAFHVQDTGVGMSPQQTARLFQPFSQVDASTTRRFGGTGLGLAITRQLVGLMKGTIEVESTPARGTAFTVVFEFDEVAGAAALETPRATPEPQPGLPELAGLRVLVVEDHPMNQALAMKLLTRAGAAVTVAENGRVAVELLEHSPRAFDAVLMDLQMPELDGYQATEQIRGRLGLSTLPIIATSAHALAEEKDRCLRAGMNAHLPKPIDVEALYRALARSREQPRA